MSDEVREMTTTEWIWSLGAAAGPWVKIEPGCEMPEDMEPLICARGKKAWTGWRRDGEWRDQDGLVRDPTHYAMLRMPEETK